MDVNRFEQEMPVVHHVPPCAVPESFHLIVSSPLYDPISYSTLSPSICPCTARTTPVRPYHWPQSSPGVRRPYQQRIKIFAGSVSSRLWVHLVRFISDIAQTLIRSLPMFTFRRIVLRPGCRYSSTSANHMRYGFVGLGQMGYPMALNLLRKTSPQSTLTVYDVNPLSLSRFANEAASITNAPRVTIAHTPKDLA